MIENEELAVVEFYGAHYNSDMLLTVSPGESEWLIIESCSIFYPVVDKKLCPVRNKCARTSEATTQCVLRNLRVHYYDLEDLRRKC